MSNPLVSLQPFDRAVCSGLGAFAETAADEGLQPVQASLGIGPLGLEIELGALGSRQGHQLQDALSVDIAPIETNPQWTLSRGTAGHGAQPHSARRW